MNRDRSPGTVPAAGCESLVVFTLGGGEYAIPTGEVGEVLRMVAVTPLPGAPAWLSGIVNLRGRVVPVIDLRTRLGFPDAPIGLSTPILIVEIDGIVAGLIADSVQGMASVSADELTWPGESDAPTPFVRAIAHVPGRLILVVDVSSVCEGVASFLSADV